MTEQNSSSLDILGVKPVADAVSHVSKVTVDGASSFLSRICLPAAEEFGLLLQDKVRAWRAANAIRVVTEAQALLQKFEPMPDGHAHPRLVASVIEEGSWSDDATLQEMCGGLLASSCSQDGHDDSNLIFIGLLKQLTRVQVRLLRFSVEQAKKGTDSNGLITVIEPLMTDISTVLRVAEVDDIHRVDQELDHLRGSELIAEGFATGRSQANLMPTALAINLYVRCQGYRGNAADYFGIAKSEGVTP
ncbi:MAG: hypothetical protein IPN00_08730 [Hydrogenophilales bacterium]|nr:hypothetical protein [Hydrogenophilales bacterium]